MSWVSLPCVDGRLVTGVEDVPGVESRDVASSDKDIVVYKYLVLYSF